MNLKFNDNAIDLNKDDKKFKFQSKDGLSPVDMLVSSVAACGMYVFRAILRNSNVDVEFVDTKVSFEVDESISAKPLKAITIDYYLKAKASDHEKIVRINKLVAKHCPVMLSLDKKIVVSENINYL